jgi:SSS family solute:Na+ symporter
MGITALLAGFMAGQAGNVSALNTVWTYDIYRVVLKTDRLRRAPGLGGPGPPRWWASCSRWPRPYHGDEVQPILDYIQAIFSWVNAPLFATMLRGWFGSAPAPPARSRGSSPGGQLFSIFLGFKLDLFGPGLTRALTFRRALRHVGNLWQAIWAWLVCFLCEPAISPSPGPKPDAELEGLVKGLTPKADDGAVLAARPARRSGRAPPPWCWSASTSTSGRQSKLRAPEASGAPTAVGGSSFGSGQSAGAGQEP